MAANITKLVTKTSPTSALDGLNMLLNAHQEYTRIRETEHTKRDAIKAWRDIEVNRTNQQVDVLKTYLKESFAERKEMIDGYFDALNKGIENNNNVAIQMAMSGLVNLVQSSPLTSVNQFLAMMDDPNVKEIEF